MFLRSQIGNGCSTGDVIRKMIEWEMLQGYATGIVSFTGSDLGLMLKAAILSQEACALS
jgi:hypothetical protein